MNCKRNSETHAETHYDQTSNRHNEGILTTARNKSLISTRDPQQGCQQISKNFGGQKAVGQCIQNARRKLSIKNPISSKTVL